MNWEKDLLDLLKANWALTDPSATNIEWTRSFIPEILRKTEAWKPVIAISGYTRRQADVAGVIPKLEGETEVRVSVILFAKSQRKTDIEAVKDKRISMIEEIERILVTASMPVGWIRAYVSRSEGREDLEVMPPRIEENLGVRIHYWR